jgi:tRNA/rRNA methyltransferase
MFGCCMKRVIVLVEPARATNVGAAARAIKTMGFTQLALVNSDLHRTAEARWVAHGATDILEQAQVYTDLAALRAGCDVLIATTARERGSSRHYLSPDQLKMQLAQQQGSIDTVALVFGREASGLTNEELALCDLWSYVPLAAEFPSLNLGQAVMVYCHALSNNTQTLGLQPDEADAGQLQHLKQRVLTLLDTRVADCDAKLYEWLAESLPRLSDRDVRMSHQLLNRLFRQD